MADKPITNETVAIDAADHEPPSNRRARRWMRGAANVAIEVFGDLFAVLAGLLILSSYLANTLLIKQSSSLAAFQPTLKRLMAQSFDGADARYKALDLKWYPARDALILQAENIDILNGQGERVQDLALLRAGFHLDGLVDLKPDLRSVEIIGGDVTWLERDDGSVIAGLGRPKSVGQFGSVYRGTSEGGQRQNPDWLSQFSSITLQDSQLFVVNERNGLDLLMKVNALRGQRDGDQLALNVSGTAFTGSALTQDDPPDPITSELDPPSSGTLNFRLRSPDALQTLSIDWELDDLRLDQIAPRDGRFSIARTFALPISAQGSGIYSRKDGLRAIEMDINAGAGIVTLAGEAQPVSSVHFNASLDTGEERMTVNHIALSSDLVSFDGDGIVRELGRLSDGDINTSPVFDLNFDSAKLDLTPTFESSLQFRDIDAIGQIDLDARSLSFSSLEMRPNADRTYALALNGEIRSTRDSLSLLRITGSATETLTAPDLLALWPVEFASGARRWINRSVLGGTIDSLTFDINLDDDFFQDRQLTPERVKVDMSVIDGTVKYISTMTPITEAFASGSIEGNQLFLDLASGRIGNVVLTEGRVDIPRLMPKGGDILISAQADAPAQDLLGLVDQPPFEYLQRYGVSPDGFGGTGSLKLTVKRPLLEFFDRDRIEYSVAGTFTDGYAPFTLGGYSISQADVAFEGGKDGIFLSGPANLGPWRADVSWAERYGQNGEPTRYTVDGTIDAATLDAFGVPSRQILGGELGIKLDVTGRGINVDRATLDADLTQAEISFGTAWNKTSGQPGQLSAVMSRSAGITEFERFVLEAPGLALQGSASFREDFALRSAQLNQVSIDGLINGKATLARAPYLNTERFDLDIEGAFLNVSDYVKNALQSRSQGWALPVELDAAFAQVLLGEDYMIEDGVMRYVHSGEAVESLVLTGTRPNGPLTGSIVQTEAGRNASLRIPDMSLAVEAVYGITATQGGALQLDADLPPSGQPGATFGTLNVDDFTVSDAPFLAQLLSLASLTGLLDALSGDGLGFDTLSTDFALRQRQLSLRDARMSGPALGLTAEGEVNFEARDVDIEGALVPAYTANSLLNDVPLIGDIFTDKDGEGVFALTYTVDGTFDSAQIAVNPLSALTPGFLRGIFRSDREDIDPEMIDQIESVRPNSETDGDDAD